MLHSATTTASSGGDPGGGGAGAGSGGPREWLTHQSIREEMAEAGGAWQRFALCRMYAVGTTRHMRDLRSRYSPRQETPVSKMNRCTRVQQMKEADEGQNPSRP